MNDENYIRRCIELGQLGEGWVEPNPMVGCVITKNEHIVAEGYHKKFGEAHAEVNAIQSLQEDPSTCTLYVNLEPCSHQGKTPPCADLIIEKGFKKVVIGALDPNPQVAGQGAKKLEEAGIEVISGVIESECESFNRRFYYHHRNNKPFITLKWAETKDGFIGRHLIDSHLGKQISNNESRPFAHRLRASHQAILVGANTANLDNPRLTSRFWDGSDPLKIILSKRNTVEPSLHMLHEGKTLIYNSMRAFSDDYVEGIHLHHDFFMDELMEDLVKRNIQSILVEGGTQVLQTFIDRGWWNEAYRNIGKQEWETGVRAPSIEADISERMHFGDQVFKKYLNV